MWCSLSDLGLLIFLFYDWSISENLGLLIFILWLVNKWKFGPSYFFILWLVNKWKLGPSHFLFYDWSISVNLGLLILLFYDWSISEKEHTNYQYLSGSGEYQCCEVLTLFPGLNWYNSKYTLLDSENLWLSPW